MTVTIPQGFTGGAVGPQVAQSGHQDSLKARIALCAAKIGGCATSRDILNRGRKLMGRIDLAKNPWRVYAKLLKQADLYGYDFTRAFSDPAASHYEGAIGNAMIAVDGLNGGAPEPKPDGGKKRGGARYRKAAETREAIIMAIAGGATLTAEIADIVEISREYARKTLGEMRASGAVIKIGSVPCNHQSIWGLPE